MKPLTNIDRKNINVKPKKLAELKPKQFKIAIAHKLANGYCFNSLRPRNKYMEFKKFIDRTINKELSISDVDRLYRKKDDKKDNIEGHEIIHYGLDRSSFRLHGYYNIHGYFVIFRIDPDHKFHK